MCLTAVAYGGTDRANGSELAAATPVKDAAQDTTQDLAHGKKQLAGRTAIGDLDWSRAIRIYQPLAAAATPGSDAWTRATFCLAVAEQQLQPPDAGTIDAARKLYQSVIDQSKDTRYVARSLMNLGRIAELKDFSADPVDLKGARTFLPPGHRAIPSRPDHF